MIDTIKQATGMVWDHLRGQAWNGAISLGLDQQLGSQECLLSIVNKRTAAQLSISAAATVRGCIGGVQTLRQIIMQCGLVLLALHIQDRSAYLTRIYSLDVTCGRVPTMD